jgi:hypothetical protein
MGTFVDPPEEPVTGVWVPELLAAIPVVGREFFAGLITERWIRRQHAITHAIGEKARDGVIVGLGAGGGQLVVANAFGDWA